MPLDAHIVSHTHWDREWYRPFERFRQRLAALIDELLDQPADARRTFLLDGQAVLIEDYLAIRPERAQELYARLASGALEAGPWYVLADELIPSGEALVRNLLTGRRVLERMGAESPPVLYCPDSFGHPAALPEIALGFGLPVILLWRGYGSRRWPAGDTARWSGPDGESVMLFHLPRDGYEFGSHLPTDAAAARERWQRMRGELASRSTTDVVLIPNGADHHALQVDAAAAIDALEAAGGADRVHRSSLRRFTEALLECAATQQLPNVHGELRDSYGYTWTLQGTFATRAHEKRLNACLERSLLREAEPWSTLAAHGGRSRRRLVESAWRNVLEAQPHDTLCGCSIDDVAFAMEQRLRSAQHEAFGIRTDAIADLIGHDPVAARDERDRWRPIVIVRNPSPRARSGVAIVDVEQLVARVAVGPGSAVAPGTSYEAPTTWARIPSLGRLQVLAKTMRHSLTESPRHYPMADLVGVQRVAAWVSDAPAYGLASYEIDAGTIVRSHPTHPVVVERAAMRNATLAVRVADDGTVNIEQLQSGRTIASLLELIDEDDVGDLYTPAPRPRDVVVQCRGVRRVHRGPLRGELELRYRMSAPRSRRADVDVNVRLILDADAQFLRVAVFGDNQRADHRLRLAFRSDVPDAAVWADAAFGSVHREPLVIDEADAVMEHAQPTAPLQRYVSLFNDAKGFTLFSDGLGEYEARPDGAVLVTLLRAVGELSRNDLPERPGHAGWPASTPAAQCLGSFEAAFAVMFHGPRSSSTIDEIECAADDVLLPMTGDTLRSALRVPEPVAGVELVGKGLAFSTLKESENGEWLVLRCVNLLEEEVAGAWRLPFDVAEARLARLDETTMSELVSNGAEVPFSASPRAVVTILVR